MSGSKSFVGKAERWSLQRPGENARPTGYILLLFRVHREDEQWVGLCEELGISSCADTAGDALDATFDATELYLNTIEELGERERVFKERGITISPAEPAEDVTAAPPHPGEVVSPQRLVLTDA